MSLAIGGVTRTKDGTYVTPAPRASTPPSSHSSLGGSDEKDRDLQNLREIAEESDEIREEVEDGKRRRSTITFGTIAEKVESRQRGSTVTAPASGEHAPALGPIVGGEDHVGMREVAKEPRVVGNKE